MSIINQLPNKILFIFNSEQLEGPRVSFNLGSVLNNHWRKENNLFGSPSPLPQLLMCTATFSFSFLPIYFRTFYVLSFIYPLHPLSKPPNPPLLPNLIFAEIIFPDALTHCHVGNQSMCFHTFVRQELEEKWSALLPIPLSTNHSSR